MAFPVPSSQCRPPPKPCKLALPQNLCLGELVYTHNHHYCHQHSSFVSMLDTASQASFQLVTAAMAGAMEEAKAHCTTLRSTSSSGDRPTAWLSRMGELRRVSARERRAENSREKPARRPLINIFWWKITTVALWILTVCRVSTV